MDQDGYFLDEIPGETRGVIRRNGEYAALYIEREADRPEWRLGTRLVGRVARVEPGMKAAFVDLDCGEPFGFLTLPKAPRLDVGARIEVRVSAEPREDKGPVLKFIGLASGGCRILETGPSVRDIMTDLSGGDLITGLPAIRASLEAEEAALAVRFVRSDVGLDIAVQRTRALVAVDIDYAPLPGRDSRRGRETVNRVGLNEAARLVALKGWGGTVAVDLAGVHLHTESVNRWAREAFAAIPQAAFGPLSRFGLLQLSLPWRHRPVDEVLATPDATLLDAVRRLNLALHEDRAQPVWTLECALEHEKALAPRVDRLGPRARLVPREGVQGFTIRKG